MTNINTYKGLDYTSLLEWMNGRKEKKLAHNTYCLAEDDHIAVKYHASIIAEVYPDKLILDNDGWYTSTTKLRLNWFLEEYRMTISQINYEWIVYSYGQWDIPYGKFTGRMEVSLPEKIISGLAPMEDNRRKKELSRIKKYAKKYVNLLLSGKILTPSNGDCLMCHKMIPTYNGYDHIKMHIEESYFVPSLILRAIEYKPVSRVAMWTIADIWSDEPTESVRAFNEISKSQLYASLWAYMLYCYDMSHK